MKKVLLIALVAVILCPRGARGQASSGDEERAGLLEATVSRDFNYGLIFAPVGKGVAFDAQYYWTERGGSQALLGIAYVKKFGELKLTPGIYYVSETCLQEGPKPWGCHDVAIGLGWEWANRDWGSRGFLAQTLRQSELRFGLADPAQAFRRFHGGRFELGLALVGEEEKENGKTRLLGKGGSFARGYFGKRNAEGMGRNYAETNFLTGHGGPTVRFTIGRTF